MEIQKRKLLPLWVAIAILSLALIGLAIAWGIIGGKQVQTQKNLEKSLEEIYEKGYYELCHELSQVSDYLNKLRISESKEMQQKLLSEVQNHSVKAVGAMSGIVRATGSGTEALGFMNKISDLALSLNNKLISNGELEETDRDNLAIVYVQAVMLQDKLSAYSEEVQSGNYSFIDNMEEDNSFLNDNSEQGDEYPTLIYDGPFSDALENKEAKGLSGDYLPDDALKRKAASFIENSYDSTLIATLEGAIQSKMFKIKAKDVEYYVTLSVKGGNLVSITTTNNATSTIYSEEDCVKIGEDYLEKIGIKQMKAVWASIYDNVWYINYAYYSNDTIFYPDMIKIKVSAENKEIIGVECLGYLYNHEERKYKSDIDIDKIASNRLKGLTLLETRLAVIPTDWGDELLTVEICAKNDDDFYFVYINPDTGIEEKILRVVDSSLGRLIV